MKQAVLRRKCYPGGEPRPVPRTPIRFTYPLRGRGWPPPHSGEAEVGHQLSIAVEIAKAFAHQGKGGGGLSVGEGDDERSGEVGEPFEDAACGSGGEEDDRRVATSSGRVRGLVVLEGSLVDEGFDPFDGFGNCHGLAAQRSGPRDSGPSLSAL